MKRKIGTIEYSAELVNLEPDKAQAIFAMLGFVPVRAECMFISNTIEADGYCDKFREIEAGYRHPKYQIKPVYTEPNDDSDPELIDVLLIEVDYV